MQPLITPKQSKPTLSFWEKAIWFFLAASVVLICTATAGFYVFNKKLETSYPAEIARVEKERQEIFNQKCIEPRTEYEARFSKFFARNKLIIDDSFEAAGLTPDQLTEASSLKVEKQLVEDACNDARTELLTIQEASKWDYFKAQWKSLLD